MIHAPLFKNFSLVPAPYPLFSMDSNETTIAQVNARKRKAEGDDVQDSSPSDPAQSEDMLVDSASGSFSNAPRQHPSTPWLSPTSGLWPSGDSPPISPLVEMPDHTPRCQKRPRLERDEPTLRPMKRLPKRQRSTGGTPLRSSPPCPPSRFWRRSDIRDMGIVPVQDPVPLADSLYHVRGGPCASGCPQHLLPSPLPPINVRHSTSHFFMHILN